MKRINIVFALLFWASVSISAQTAGQIFESCNSIPNPLDPNNDGWITASGTPFTSPDQEEIEQEVSWIRIFSGINYLEPNSDPSSGGSCGQTDLVENNLVGTGTASYYRYDSTLSNIIFRIRVASNPTGNFGYVVLIDTDMKYGILEEPNYVPSTVNKVGNPGFEREIRLVTGGTSGIFVDNVDGVLSKNAININSYSLISHYQRSYSAGSDTLCSSTTSVFIDFFVPLADLGIGPNDPIRFVPATTTNGASVLGATAADIGGVDDNLFLNIESAIDAAITEQTGSKMLPVELASFDAEFNGQTAKLIWTTKSEINSDHFVIQRSNGSNGFSDIGVVFATGNSNNTIEYEYSDIIMNPEGTYYYRLQIVDIDGSFKFSNIQSVNIQIAKEEIKIYPNPVLHNEPINIESSEPIHKIMITDLAGRTNYQIIRLSEYQFIPNDFIPSGTYLVVIYTENGNRFHNKLIIQ